jgi:hypothetical protein
MERKRKTNPELGRGSCPKPQCRGVVWRPAHFPAYGRSGAACSVRPQAEKWPSWPTDAARRAPWVVTTHGTPAVARSPASDRGTRCGGTGGVSSSRRRGRRRAQLRGRTLTGWAVRRWGRKKKVGAAALLDGEGAPGTSTAPGVALQLREGNEWVRPTRI